MPNPGLDLYCSKCGRRLVYLRTEGDRWVYLCLLDGALKLSMNEYPDRRWHPERLPPAGPLGAELGGS